MSIFEALELVTLLVGVVVVVAMGVGAMKERLRALEDAVRTYHTHTEQNLQRVGKRIDAIISRGSASLPADGGRE